MSWNIMKMNKLDMSLKYSIESHSYIPQSFYGEYGLFNLAPYEMQGQ